MLLENYDKCALLLPFNGVNNGISFPDYGIYNTDFSVFGDAKTVTAQSKYYGSSGYFDGNGDYLQAGYNPNIVINGTDDFTFSIWYYPTTNAIDQTLYTSGEPDATAGTQIGISIAYFGSSLSGKLRCFFYNSSTQYGVDTLSALTLNAWNHIGFTRKSGTIYLGLNGVIQSSLSANVSINNSLNFVHRIARYTDSIPRFLNGYLADLAFVKGVGLWDSNYTVPAALTGEISGNVKDAAAANASRIITACPRTNPTRAFSTVSDAGTGNYTLRVPSTEVSRIALADEGTLYNDIVDRIIPA